MRAVAIDGPAAAGKSTLSRRLAQKLGFCLDNSVAGSVSDISGVQRAESLGLDVELAERCLGYLMPTFSSVIDCVVDEYKMNRSIVG